MAKKVDKASVPTVTVRMPADLAEMLNVIAACQNKSAVEVLAEHSRGWIVRLHDAEIAKRAKRKAGD